MKKSHLKFWLISIVNRVYFCTVYCDQGFGFRIYLYSNVRAEVRGLQVKVCLNQPHSSPGEVRRLRIIYGHSPQDNVITE